MRLMGLCLLLGLIVHCRVQGGSKCSGVEIDVVSAFLKPVPTATLRLEGGGHRTLSVISDELGGVCVPLSRGRYSLTVMASGFRQKQEMIDVEILPHCFVLVLEVGRVNDVEPVTIRGKAANVEKYQPLLWADLRHVLGSSHQLARIGRDGTFRLVGDFSGIFELRVISPAGVIACTTISLGAGDQFIEVSAGDRCLPVSTSGH